MDGAYGTDFVVEVVGPRKMITFSSGGTELFSISETVVTGWLIILVLAILFRVLTHNMKVKPETKRQVIAEWIVGFFSGLVKDNMGRKMEKYAPYITTIFCFGLFGSLISVLGFRSMTADINCTGTWALFTFALITYHKIKANGFGGYLKGFAEPTVVITPINLLSEVATPTAMALRMFGNISSGMIITTIIYAALTLLSNVTYNALHAQIAALEYFKVFQIGLPAVLSVYFDYFSSTIQSYVFVMLTMVYVGDAAGRDN